MAMSEEDRKEKESAYQKAYREANKEKMKAWREANRDKHNAYCKSYAEANPEKIKVYYEANKENLKAKARAYYQANKEKLNAQTNAWREANPEKLQAYQDKAKSKYIKRSLSPRICKICGNEFSAKGTVKSCSSECKEKARRLKAKNWHLKKNPVKYTQKICVLCKKDFIVVSGSMGKKRPKIQRVYCSEECRLSANIIRSKTPRYRKICLVCNTEFLAQNINGKSCSAECQHILIHGIQIEVTCPICGNKRMCFDNVRSFKARKTDICERCNGVIHNRVSSKKPNARLKDRLRCRDRYANLTDTYVRTLLKPNGCNEPTDEMIELKRQSMIIKRELRKLKKWRKENDPTITDVPRVEHQDETFDECT